MERKIVEWLIRGAGVNQICRELKVGKHRVAEIRDKAEEAGYLKGEKLPPYPEGLFPDSIDGRTKKSSPAWAELEGQRNWIKERLESGWHAVTVYEELAVKVPRSNFYRFLIHHKLNKVGRDLRRVVPEILHEPGEALIIDWGYLWMIEWNGRRVKLWAFVGILGYSRQMVVRLMVVCDVSHTFEALREILETLGGVASRITSDNPKVFALQANKYESLLNPAYERFAAHYGTIVECLPPKTPQLKGKVERPMPYVRRLFEAYEGDKNDLKAFQAYIDRKVEIANQRKHGTTCEQPVRRFEDTEREKLKPLPALPYVIEQFHEGTVRLDGHVRFQNKYYSVDEEYIGKDIVVIGNHKQIFLYYKGKLLEVHDRVIAKNQTKSTKPHHLKPWQRVCDNEKGLRELGAKIGPAVETFVNKVLLQGDGFIDFRKIWGVLSLNKKYSNEQVNRACEFALDAEVLSYRTVVHFLEQDIPLEMPISSSKESALPQNGKFQHDLAEYKQLIFNFSNHNGETYEH